MIAAPAGGTGRLSAGRAGNSRPMTARLEQLRPVVEPSGTFATVIVPPFVAGEELVERARIQAKQVRSELDAAGLGSVADEVESMIVEHRGADGVGVVVSAAGGVVLSRDLLDVAVEVREPTVTTGPIAHVVPFVRDAHERRSHLVVAADRTGATLVALDHDGRLSGATVDGQELHTQKVSQGGWSQARLQRHSEHTWDQNAKEIAESVVMLADDVGAHLLIAAGDERAVQLLRGHLPTEWAEKLQVIDIEPTDDHDWDTIATQTRALVRDHVARYVVNILEDFAEKRGQGNGLAADGGADTLTALRRSQVDTLLVPSNADEVGNAFAADTPTLVSTDPNEIENLGAEPIEAPLVDVAVRAALSTGATVIETPAHGAKIPKGPIGAILRFATD